MQLELVLQSSNQTIVQQHVFWQEVAMHDKVGMQPAPHLCHQRYPLRWTTFKLTQEVQAWDLIGFIWPCTAA